MRIILFLVMLILPALNAYPQDRVSDSLLKSERDFYYNRYKTIRDTMTINSWINLKRLSDNLEEVVKRDHLRFEALNSQEEIDSSLLINQADMTARFNELAQENDVLQSRTQNDMKMMLYLKSAVGVLLLLLVILIFSLVGRAAASRKNKKRADHYESLAEKNKQELETTEAELRRLKAREMEFREELEKGIQLNQERLVGIQQKCAQLEAENEALKSGDSKASFSLKSSSLNISDLPSDAEELKNLVKQLSDERDSLMKLAAQLQQQIEQEKSRRIALIENIRTLAGSLAKIEDAHLE